MANETPAPPAPTAQQTAARNAQAQALAVVRLGHVQIAILDYDIHAAQLIRKALTSLGISHTHLSRNSREMVEIIKDRPVDILIAEWDSRPENGLDFTRNMRSPASSNRTLPIVMMTSRNTPEEMLMARSSGVNDILIRPFNVRVLLDCITNIIDSPRPFIISRNYTGPDRRRAPGPLPEGVEERRGKGGAAMAPILITKEMLGETFIDDRPRILPPENAIKQRIEAASTRMAGIESILPQAEAAKREDDFLQWMLTDMVAMRQAFDNLTANPDNARVYMDRLVKGAQSIRTRAMPTGYKLAVKLSVTINDFCQRSLDIRNAHHMTILSKHMDVLQAVLNHKLAGDGGAIGRELMNDLQALIKKYS